MPLWIPMSSREEPSRNEKLIFEARANERSRHVWWNNKSCKIASDFVALNYNAEAINWKCLLVRSTLVERASRGAIQTESSRIFFLSAPGVRRYEATPQFLFIIFLIFLPMLSLLLSKHLWAIFIYCYRFLMFFPWFIGGRIPSEAVFIEQMYLSPLWIETFFLCLQIDRRTKGKNTSEDWFGETIVEEEKLLAWNKCALHWTIKAAAKLTDKKPNIGAPIKLLLVHLAEHSSCCDDVKKANDNASILSP